MAAAVLTFLIAGVSCRRNDTPSAPPAVKPQQADAVARAKLQQVRGDVRLKRAAGDDWQPAKDGVELFENDKLRTEKGASALVVFANGSVVSLMEDALVGISETEQRPGRDRTDVTVLKGHIDAALEHPAEQSLSVSTPSATVRAGREITFR